MKTKRVQCQIQSTTDNNEDLTTAIVNALLCVPDIYATVEVSVSDFDERQSGLTRPALPHQPDGLDIADREDGLIRSGQMAPRQAAADLCGVATGKECPGETCTACEGTGWVSGGELPSNTLWIREFGQEWQVPAEITDDMGIYDMSWHNDSSPSFALFGEAEHDKDAFLWVDHVDPGKREMGGPRYMVIVAGRVLYRSETSVAGAIAALKGIAPTRQDGPTCECDDLHCFHQDDPRNPEIRRCGRPATHTVVDNGTEVHQQLWNPAVCRECGDSAVETLEAVHLEEI